ncbi:DNA-binding CsgD family transcriptional regulator/PAS domain-containing protein [Aminobacter niigataensis]|uniref:DNA-binding CsgD family transcriptional regulator/PAS domain-containing protein n=1 Tax=Aminobacter niigataensis TaxID=83265 RepID=A0ABR6L5E5_9HYPH|nr:PAS domain-containing protein [Aminobacter niigataensis]MBB4652009.1 DNA-binding CsgD family transcriptional regulator/PAS domain-containing protein [Aminobacter niigataensis]
MMAKRNLDGFLDRLYEAAIDASCWPAALAEAVGLFESRSAQIGHLSLVDQRLSFVISHGYDITPERIRSYEELMGEDPRLAPFVARPFVPMHCRMIVSDEAFHASRLYREVLAPDGIEYTLGVNLIEEEQSTSFFMMLRGPDRPRFGEVECEILRELVPHLRRVIKLHTRFAEIDLDRLVAQEALDRLPLGVAVVRANSRIVSLNRIARDLAMAGDGFSIFAGMLVAERHPDTQRLQAAIATAARGDTRRSQALTLRRDKGEPLRLLVCPLSANRVGQSIALPPSDLVMVFISDPEQLVDAQSEQLQHMFGLTRSEARLLELLVAGATLKVAAGRLDLTHESARQYLKSMFVKTGSHRQSDLIRKVLSSPVWMQQ